MKTFIDDRRNFPRGALRPPLGEREQDMDRATANRLDVRRVPQQKCSLLRQPRVWPNVLLFFSFAAPLSAQSSGTAQISRPDVILLTIDTLRADHLRCYGEDKIETPNLDAFAASADRFAYAYTPVPITLPAHTAIMTGTYPTATGMHDFSGNKLSPDATTLAKVLHESGYETAAFVSAAVLDSRFGLNVGFNTYYDSFDVGRLDESSLDLIERRGDQTMDLALAWFGEHLGGQAANARPPLFLWVHLYDPHYPYA